MLSGMVPRNRCVSVNSLISGQNAEPSTKKVNSMSIVAIFLAIILITTLLMIRILIVRIMLTVSTVVYKAAITLIIPKFCCTVRPYFNAELGAANVGSPYELKHTKTTASFVM